MDITNLIRSTRERAGLTQAELAKRVGTTQSAIARLEAGGANPRLATVERIMRAMGNRLAMAAVPYRASIDETLVASNLRRTPAERLAAFSTAYRNVKELAEASRSRAA